MLLAVVALLLVVLVVVVVVVRLGCFEAVRIAGEGEGG